MNEKNLRNINAEKHCVVLKKALYGLVQAARQWYKRFKKVLKFLKFLPQTIFNTLRLIKQKKTKNLNKDWFFLNIRSCTRRLIQ